MSQLKLKPWQRRRLRKQLQVASDVRVDRRTLAMLELDKGRSAAEIAEMLGVSRQSVHNWATAFADDPDPSTLGDRDRSGRPPVWDERAEDLLRSLMPASAQESGYPDTSWTVPLLQQELERVLGQMPSDETVRRGLRRLGLRLEAAALRPGSRPAAREKNGGSGGRSAACRGAAWSWPRTRPT
jgi:transposase